MGSTLNLSLTHELRAFVVGPSGDGPCMPRRASSFATRYANTSSSWRQIGFALGSLKAFKMRRLDESSRDLFPHLDRPLPT